jgi:anti-anti-sigma regulatory factor
LSDVEHFSICFSGAVTIANVGAAHAEILTAFKERRSVVIDLSDVTEADLTFIQLMEAARRSAAEAGIGLTLAHPAGPAVQEILQRGGFLDDAESDRATFWLQEATN